MSRAEVAGFDESFMRKLEYLALVSKRFAGQFKAERRAKKLGSGLEFADFRGYVPGDDFRYLDWKTYLRLGRLLLRLYEEEEDLPIYIFVDCSRSMTYGSPSKLDYARRVAAALCYIGLANLDRVTVVAYADGIKSELSPQRGKNQIFRMFQFLADISAGGTTDGKQAFKMFATGSRRRGLAVVISDFFDPAGFEYGLNLLRYYRHDVFIVQVAAHEDLEPAVRGQIQLVDSELASTHEINVTPEMAQAYRHEMERFSEDIRRHAVKYQLGYARTVTDFPFEELILQVFRQGRFLK
jgi:uncharacterized protein (DUF58 family)